MKNFTLLSKLLQKTFLLCFLIALFISVGYGQVKQVVYYNQHDVTIGSGTALNTNETNLDGAQLQICNFDHNESLMSYFESWTKFDFTTLEDSIPDGHQILYAELVFRVSANAGPQGVRFYHLYNIDEWLQEELTWNTAQDWNFETEGNFDQFDVLLPEDAGGTSSRPAINVTDQVLYEMGTEGNKLLTIRCEPYVKDYIKDDPELDKKWLGFYSREVTWDLPEGAEFNPYCPQITLWIGPEEPEVFSDIANFGDINNYLLTPSKYGYWLVRDDEGDARMVLKERPAPINSTPGGYALYNSDPYGDFDLSLKAKVTSTSAKTDFIVIFGYKDEMDYSYMNFTGEDINGFYVVDTTGGEAKTPVGDLNTDPALGDTAYHEYRVVRAGNTVTAYVDGTEYMSVTDEALGEPGLIGVGSYNDVAMFDDILEGEVGPGSVNPVRKQEITLFPNPAEGRLQITTDLPIHGIVISNVVGQEVLVMEGSMTGSMELNTSGIGSGLHLITIIGPDGTAVTKKFIIR